MTNDQFIWLSFNSRGLKLSLRFNSNSIVLAKLLGRHSSCFHGHHSCCRRLAIRAATYYRAGSDPVLTLELEREQYCTAASCHPPCSSKLETSGLFKTWLSPQTGAGTEERADLRERTGTYTKSGALGKLGFVRQMKEGWCSISRSSAA